MNHVTAAVQSERKQPRYTAYFRKTLTTGYGPRGAQLFFGFEWEVTDETTGLVVRHGWCAGPKRDAQAEARLAISELEGKS